MDVSEEWIAFGIVSLITLLFFCIFEIVLQIPDCARPVVDSQQHRTGVFFQQNRKKLCNTKLHCNIDLRTFL